MSVSKAKADNPGRKGRINPKGNRGFWSPKTREKWRESLKKKIRRV